MISNNGPGRVGAVVATHAEVGMPWLGRLVLHGTALLPLLVLLGALSGLWGCEKTAGPLPENIPPITYLSVQGAQLDTLGYRQILHWWGTDVDGEVVGYIIHWDGDWEPGPGTQPCPPGLLCPDPSWVFTTATSDTFVVPIAGSFAEWTFSVKAVDDGGAVDPEGRSQTFSLRNGMPSLRWSPSLPLLDSSLPAVSFAWNPRDPDGVETIAEFRYWLDGMDSTLAFTTRDTLIALRQEDFAGRYGRRMINVQAIDEARALSNVISHEWDVVRPEGRFMLVDNVAAEVQPLGEDDAFYRAMMDSLPGGVLVYDLEANGGFRTRQEVEPLFSMFDGVLWYSGGRHTDNDRHCIEQLRMAETGIGEYLERGGRFLLVSRTAVGFSETDHNRGLSEGFGRKYLGIEGFYSADGTTDIDNRSAPSDRSYIRFAFETPSDSLVFRRTSLQDADFMIPMTDIGTSQPLAWVPPGFLERITSRDVSPDQSADPANLGMFSSAHGRCAVFTFPLRALSPVESRDRVVARLFRKVLDSDD